MSEQLHDPHLVRSSTDDADATNVQVTSGVRADYLPPPFPIGLAPGKSTPSAVPLQRALKAAGFLPQSAEENPTYDEPTQQAVARFHHKHPRFRSKGVDQDVHIGPKGWAHLHRLAYG